MSWSQNSPQVWLCYHHFKDGGWSSNGISNWTKLQVTKVLITHAILKAPQSFDAYSCSLNFRRFYGYFRQHNEAKIVLFDSTGWVTKRPCSFSFVILSLVGARSHVRSPATQNSHTYALPSNSHWELIWAAMHVGGWCLGHPDLVAL